jgi:enoyl-CoA hydratase/carnithine racemase
MDETLATSRAISANAPLAVRQARRAIHGGQHLPLDKAMAFEIECYERLVGTEDRREGIQAFNEKRKARFTGR